MTIIHLADTLILTRTRTRTLTLALTLTLTLTRLVQRATRTTQCTAVLCQGQAADGPAHRCDREVRRAAGHTLVGPNRACGRPTTAGSALLRKSGLR